MNKVNKIIFNQNLKINQTNIISNFYDIKTPRKNNEKLFKVNYTVAKLISQKSNKKTINTSPKIIEEHKKSLSNDFILSDYSNNEKTRIRKQIFIHDFINEPIKSSILHIRTNKFQGIYSCFDFIKKEESNYIKNITEKKNSELNLKNYSENKNSVKNNYRNKSLIFKGLKTYNKISERKKKDLDYLFPLEECKKKYLFLNKSIYNEIHYEIFPKIKN